MMKKILKLSAVFIPVLLSGCKDDITPYTPAIGYEEGDVVFNIANEPTTRTMYQDKWDEEKTQAIYWGNYIANDVDNIKIYCKAAMQSQICTYKVNPAAVGADQSVAGSIEKITGDAMKWGDERTTHNFYAFYPAEAAGDAFLNNSDCIINASVDNGQSPVSYEGRLNSGKTLTTLQDIADNKCSADEMGTPDVKESQTTIYGLPDMKAAIMMAKRVMEPSQYNQVVPLQFNVMADVLDITVNGPVKPNSLGGNASESQAAQERSYIKIQNVMISAPEGISLAGNFSLDMSKEGADCVVAGSIVNGTNTIQLQTSLGGQFPTLHVRCDPGGEDANPTKDQVDHLRLRAFLIPGQVTDLSQLKITIQTDCGDYDQQLGQSTMVTGAIHPINLGFFRQAGAQFNFAKWVGQLDDNIYLSELSIPGAWHSTNAAYQGDMAGDLQKQYNAGIRAFEVHSTNGTIVYTDDTFATQLNNNNGNYEGSPRLNESVNTSTDTSNETNIERNTTQRTATCTATVTQTRTTTYVQHPQYALRLYRSQNVTPTTPNPEQSMSDAVMTLASNMNPDGLMVLEFGMSGERSVTLPGVRTTTIIETRTKTNQSLSGTYTGTGWTGYNYSWNTDNVFTDDDPWASQTSTELSTTPINARTAWVKAVETCVNKLARTDNPNTETKYVYPGRITANTTLGEVRGTCIVKVNTNVDDNDLSNEKDWSTDCPALFSRWVAESANTPATINLQWGQAIAPTPLNTSQDALHWCFTELDNIDGGSWNSSMTKRKAAISSFMDEAYNNYTEGYHRTFYECMIGGYTGGADNATATTCQDAASQLNPYLLSLLTDPSRKAAPVGLVFMNYVGGGTYNSTDFQSADLIKAVINNNRAFLLNRKPKGDVNNSTNSSFTNNPNNPLK